MNCDEHYEFTTLRVTCDSNLGKFTRIVRGLPIAPTIEPALVVL